MPAPIPLATGLGGAIGCDFRRARNQLDFVEFNGKVSRINLVRPLVATVSSGAGTIHGTFLFDFDTGTEVNNANSDVFWHQHTAVIRSMDPRNGAKIVNLGVVNFAALTHAELQGLAYDTTPINGNNDATNKLVNGDVFAVQTTAGNYAKVKVTHYDYNIQIQWVTYKVGPRYQVLGTGYNQPEDIVVSVDETTAYITERSGNLVKVSLNAANRANATAIASGLTAPHQIALDELHKFAYVVEFAPAGRLWRINLTTNAKTAIAAGLQSAVGLLMSDDGRYAYVTEQAGPGAGRVTRIDLTTNSRQTIAHGLTAPFFMTWTDAGQSSILLTERDPANRVTLIDLTQTPPAIRQVVVGVPTRPSSVAVVAENRLLVCSDSVVSEVDLTDSVFTVGGPILLGVGHVPITRIINAGPVAARGYADTTPDPAYFFQVKDTPFGGTLAIMINHERARNMGAVFYKLLVDGVEPKQSFSDYKWDNVSNTFVLHTISPNAGGFYPVRGAGEIWYNYWLGYMLDTSGLANGGRTIDVKIFNGANVEIPAGAGVIHSRLLRIDNTWPTAKIDSILHNGVAVGTCGIVHGPVDAFTFQITASDPDNHLLSWDLSAIWGDNQSKAVSSDSYSNHVSPTRQWAGVVGTVPPPGPAPWTATVGAPGSQEYKDSRNCAHTFYLRIWDRVINGFGYIHYAEYHKSITLLLDG